MPVPEAFRTNWPPAAIILELGLTGLPFPVADCEVQYKGGIYFEEWIFLRLLVPESEWGSCMMTMPSVLYQYLVL
jgi:hypothetical protein